MKVVLRLKKVPESHELSKLLNQAPVQIEVASLTEVSERLREFFPWPESMWVRRDTESKTFWSIYYGYRRKVLPKHFVGSFTICPEPQS